MFAAATGFSVFAGEAGWAPGKWAAVGIGVAIAVQITLVAGLLGLWAEQRASQIALAGQQMPVAALAAQPAESPAESQ